MFFWVRHRTATGKRIGITEREDIMARMNKYPDIPIRVFYDKKFLDSARSIVSMGEMKYRNQRVSTYLKIKLPVIERHECCDDDGEIIESGLMFKIREIKLFRIGSHIEKVPYWKKRKGGIISFVKFDPLSIKSTKSFRVNIDKIVYRKSFKIRKGNRSWHDIQ
jgi:hypothetical protein